MDKVIGAGNLLVNKLASLDAFSFWFGIIISALIGTWLNFFIARPKLKISGSGGGGGPGRFYQNNVVVTNEPALLGLRIKNTILFGWRLYRSFDIGLTIDRNTTHECRAMLYEKETGEFIKQLWWRSKNDPAAMSRSLELESGERGELVLFAQHYEGNGKYFAYEPEDDKNITPKMPPEAEKFDSTKEFEIRIQYLHGRKVFKFDCKVVKGFAGKFTFQHLGTGSF